MTTKNTEPRDAAELRRQAEEQARNMEPASLSAQTPEEIQRLLHELRVHQIELELQNEELRRAQTEIEDGRERYFDLYDLAPVGYCTLSEQGLILEANLTAATLLGSVRGLLVKQPISRFIVKDDEDIYYLNRKKLIETGEPQECDLRLVKPDGTNFWAHLTATIAQAEDGTPVCRMVIFDISERKQAETYREMGMEILRILNEPGGLQESIQRVLATLKTRTGFDAVGLRLQEGEDFPYFAQDGFSQDFLLTENTLVERGKDGGVCRDKDGNVCLECTCGLVLSGKTDPANPLFTKGGSCWTNNSFPLLDLPSAQDPRRHPRNNCIHQGYASVALIPVRIQDQMYSRETCIRHGFSSMAHVPVRTSDRIVGLIQLNDKRKGRFTLETIEILEGIAAHIGSALMRKRAEDELQESKDLYERLAAESRTIAWKVDTAGLYSYVSPMIEDVLGYRQEEIVGKLHFYDLHPEEGREAFKEEVFATMRRKESTVNLDNELVCKNGSVVWVATNAHPILDADGSLKGYRGSDRDITEQKQAAQELLRLSTAIEQAAEVVMITDVQGTIQYVNPAFTQITGYTCEEAIGQNPRILKSGKQDAEFYREMWAALTAGEVFDCRMVNRHKDGTLYTEAATISPVKDASGRILNYVAVKRDITKHLQAEAKRAELEAQLQQAHKMEAVGQLAGGVAHDFNNHLMGIMGYADFCRDGIAADHPIREWLDEITHGAERSAHLTRQLLAFARKQTIAPKALDLNDKVAGMLKMMHRLIGEDIDILWEPGAELWPLKLDPGQVDQILANLCVNARDAIGGVGKVTIETENVTIDADYCGEHAEAAIGSYVMLAVSDDGCGMGKETLEHVFDPFFTTKGIGEGTGLGLATVYGIVKQNGGFINVYSEPGKGTTFRIYLPRFVGEDAGQTESRQASRPVGGSETILLVEDEKSVLVTTARFLEQLGYTVLTAETPSAALRLAAEREGAIELLITDVVMPGMNGRDLAAKLTEDYPLMKRLFISGYTANVIAHRGILDEGIHFLAKPFTRDDIARKVYEILKGKH